MSTTPDSLASIPGFNPHQVRGCRLHGGKGLELYASPERALEVLEASVDGRSLLWSNPSGHLSRALGWLDHIEAFFTAGVENVGPPAMGMPLHGTFSLRAADDVQVGVDGEDAYVEGTIHCTDMVRGPYIDVRRRVIALADRAAFRIEDEVSARVDSQFMWLYHPNFPVQEGTRFVTAATQVRARDAISNRDLKSYGKFVSVNRGIANMPPDCSAEQNFECCFFIDPIECDQGSVTALLIDSDGNAATRIRYSGDFDEFQSQLILWKNPRGGVCGIERGNLPIGREEAANRNTISVAKSNQMRRYQAEVDFIQGQENVDAAEKELVGLQQDQVRLLVAE
ncbi:MAG: DUF4432 family protein [Planctomycetota bacterium]